MPDTNLAVELTRSVKRLVRMSVLLYVVNLVLLVSVAALFYHQHSTERRSLEARIAAGVDYKFKACSQTESLKAIIRDTTNDQIASSLQFLKDHPGGIAGVPNSLLIQGIQKQRATVVKLAPVDCHTLATIPTPPHG